MFEAYGNVVVRRLVVVALAAVTGVSAACARGGDSSSPVAPSSIAPSEASTNAAGGKNGGGSTTSSGSSLSLVLETDVAQNGVVNFGDTVTFSVSTSATTQPQVSVQCSQNGVVVFNASTAFYDGFPWPWTQHMTLQSGAWTSGAADCKATLYYTSGRKATNATLSTLSFHVDA